MPRPEPHPARETRAERATSAVEGGAPWIRDHLDAVYRYVRRRLGHADAEDVAQEAFEALFRAQAGGRAPADPGAYLFATARRRVADVLRRRSRRPEAVALPEGWEGYGREPLPPAAMESAELVELVHVALGLLPGPDARLLVDRYRRGQTTAALAERLGATPKAVEMRLRRVRQAFLAHFERVGRDWLGALDPDPASRGGGGA